MLANDRFGNTAGGTKSIYGTDKVGSEITGGVNLVGSSTYKTDNSGPRGMVGYAYASPTGSNAATVTVHATSTNGDAEMFTKGCFILDGAVSEANAKLIEYDPDLIV